MIDVGLFGVISATVTDSDTAVAFGSGDVAVLATPRVVALCEAAAVAALAGSLPTGSTSVGTSFSIDHVAASGVRATVEARATVSHIDGKRITFDVGLTDGTIVAATGTHTRVIVNRNRFEGSVSR